ncbi:SMI1/KNR4 family protein [Streptomyces sp. NPDC004980]
MAETNWTGVRERVEALARADRSRKVFGAWSAHGAGGHGFRLAEPLSERDVEAAETEWGVALPEDYRGFLLEVGAGGAGPGYGLSVLTREGTGRLWADAGGGVTRHDLLRLPFPSAELSARREAEHAEVEPRKSGFEDEAAFLAAHRVWREREDELIDLATSGALNLNHEGCGYCHWLVVSGPDRGSMWLDERPSDGAVFPLGRPPARVTFADWFLGWVEKSEAVTRRQG